MFPVIFQLDDEEFILSDEDDVIVCLRVKFSCCVDRADWVSARVEPERKTSIRVLIV